MISLPSIAEHGSSPTHATSPTSIANGTFAAGTSSTHAFGNGGNGSNGMRNGEGTRAPSALLGKKHGNGNGNGHMHRHSDPLPYGHGQGRHTAAGSPYDHHDGSYASAASDDDYTTLTTTTSTTGSSTTSSSSLCRHSLPRVDKNTTELWASVQVPESVPYFGGFLTLLTTSRSPPLYLRWNVEPPRMAPNCNDLLPLVLTWPPHLRNAHDTPFLKMSMSSWPTLSTCVNCPWRERLFKRRSFAGFFVRANMISFTNVATHDSQYHGEIATAFPIDHNRAGATTLSMTSLMDTTIGTNTGNNGMNDTKTVASCMAMSSVSSVGASSSTGPAGPTNGNGPIHVRRNNMYMYYTNDDTRLGSLYYTIAGSLIQYRMPLDTITAVYIGSQGPFWPHIAPTGLVTPQQIRDECFTLQSSNGVLLHLSCGSQIQRRLWLRRMWHLQVKGGRTCTSASIATAAPVPAPYIPTRAPAAVAVAAMKSSVPCASPSSIESVTSPRHHLSIPSAVASYDSSSASPLSSPTHSYRHMNNGQSSGNSNDGILKFSSRATHGYSYDHPSIASAEANISLPILNGQPIAPSSPTSPSTIAPPPLSTSGDYHSNGTIAPVGSSSSLPTVIATPVPIRFATLTNSRNTNGNNGNNNDHGHDTSSISSSMSSVYATALSNAHQRQQSYIQQPQRPGHYRASSMPLPITGGGATSIYNNDGSNRMPFFTKSSSTITPSTLYVSAPSPSAPSVPSTVAATATTTVTGDACAVASVAVALPTVPSLPITDGPIALRIN